MAKRPRRQKQKRIEGTFDVVPADLQLKADQYVETLRERQQTQSRESELREEVVALMRAHNIAEIEIDDGEKVLRLVSKGDAIKIKRKSEAKVAENGELEVAFS